MSASTCKKLLLPHFIIARVIIQACSFTILGWGCWASILEHVAIAAIVVCMEVVHYGMLWSATKANLVSAKNMTCFKIIELLFAIPFIVLLILIMVKDWPINWIHIYVASIQLSLPSIRIGVYAYHKGHFFKAP